MTTESGSFEARYAEMHPLIDKRFRLDQATRAARDLVRDFPDRARAYYVLNLILCLSKKDGGARGTINLIDLAQTCPDATDTVIGDMQRDRVIGLMRSHKADDLDLADRLTTEVEQLHREDDDRIAYLTGVRGRLAFARGQAEVAEGLHAEADRMWRDLGDEADAGWVYLNLVQWLRAAVATKNAGLAATLLHRIKTEVPAGMRSREREAKVIMVPLIGPFIYAMLERLAR